MTTIIEEKTTTDYFFKNKEFRNKLLHELGMGIIKYKDLPIKLKYRRAVLMKADIRDVLEDAPLSVYRKSFCIEGMIFNLLSVEEIFYSINEYKKLIDNMKEAKTQSYIWIKAIRLFKKSMYSEIILGYIFNGRMDII